MQITRIRHVALAPRLLTFLAKQEDFMNALASFGTDNPVALQRDVSFHPAMSALRSSTWFSSFPQNALASLSMTASLCSFGTRQQILLEGRWLGAAILVVKGGLRAVRRTDNARELTLEIFRPGDLIADAALFPDGALPSDGLVAAETSLLLFIPREDFLSALSGVPQAALTVIRDLEKRLNRVKLLASGLATSDVESRLYRLLVNLARDEGQATGEATVISRSPTQQDLASRIGACRETVSRIVADLARQQVLSLEGRKLTLAPRFFEIAKSAGIA
jgi:CRP/FNR family transcriptional regulator, cyclic AMP receptor protein